MIYFKKNLQNFIFIHIPKVAGTSIKEALFKNFESCVDLTISKNNSIFNFEDNVDHHAPIFYIKSRLNITNYKFIVVVRNPWARMFSLFQHTMLKIKDRKFFNNLELDTRSIYNPSFKMKSSEEMHRINDLNQCFEFWLNFIGRNKKLIPNGNPNFNILPQSWFFLENNLLEKNILFFNYENLSELENFLELKFYKTNNNLFKSNDDYKKIYNNYTIKYITELEKFTIKKFNYIF